MAKKKSKARTKPSAPTQNNNTIEIDVVTEEPTVCFVLGDEKIEDTVVTFHRLGVQAQSEAFNNRNETENYMPEYADLLNRHFKTQFHITEPVAYRIFDASFNLFHQLKKNSTT